MSEFYDAFKAPAGEHYKGAVALHLSVIVAFAAAAVVLPYTAEGIKTLAVLGLWPVFRLGCLSYGRDSESFHNIANHGLFVISMAALVLGILVFMMNDVNFLPAFCAMFLSFAFGILMAYPFFRYPHPWFH